MTISHQMIEGLVVKELMMLYVLKPGVTIAARNAETELEHMKLFITNEI